MTNKKNNKRQTKGSVSQLVDKLVKQKISTMTGGRKQSRNTPFADVGAHLGGFIGHSEFGRGIGGVIGRIMGSGDYTTNFDTVKNTLTSPVPAFGNESTMITHREYIGDVISAPVAGAFQISRYRINPADSITMPWLSGMAQNFEEYSISGMIFEFKTTSGASVASTNTSLGTVILATQYDPTKLAFSNKQEMENHFFAQSTVPSNSVLHAVECKRGEAPLSRLYVAEVSDSNYDPRFSDFGNFSIATVGQPGSNVNLGELWVSYKISLHKPRLNLYAGGVAFSGKSARASATTALPLGSIGLYNKGRLNIVSASNSFSFDANPGDTYMVTILWSGVGAPTTNPAFSLINAIFTTNQFINNTANVEFPGFGATEDRVAVLAMLTSTLTTTGRITMGLSGGTFPAAANFVDIIVTSMDPKALA